MTRKNQQHPGKNSVLPSLGKTENKVKNHNDNPANIQVNKSLFPNMTSQKNLPVPHCNKKLIKKLTCSSPHYAMFQGMLPYSGTTFRGTLPCSRVCPNMTRNKQQLPM